MSAARSRTNDALEGRPNGSNRSGHEHAVGSLHTAPLVHPEDVHLADFGDVDPIIALLEESAQWMVSIGILRWQPGVFVASTGSLRSAVEARTVYVWKTDGVVRGTIRLTEQDHSVWGVAPGPALYVHKLTVQRSLKGHGFGTRLLQWAEDQARTRKLDRLRLDCWSENVRLCHYYDCLGFRRAGVVRVEGWLHQLFEKPVTREREVPWTR
jgi:GNAT superfamily N-acetyltransferase